MSAQSVSIPFDEAGLADGWLEGLGSVGLTELNDKAALQTRTDRKYVLPVGRVTQLLDGLRAQLRVLQIDGLRTFGYESVYFDTPDLISYRSAAHRRRRRFKVRTRSYLDSGLCWAEVKTRGPRGSTIKNRLPHRFGDRQDLGAVRDFVDSTLTAESVPGTERMEFVPTLTTRYRRSTLLLPATSSRVTIDTELAWSDGVLDGRLTDLAVVETKTGSGACSVDRLLWAHGQRPIRISKYATGLASLHPDLPATPWRRTLRRHFAVR